MAERVYKLTKSPFVNGPGDLVDQLRRAALSVSNNIAEGFERGTTPELLQFLYIARGSAGEVRSMLHFCGRLLAESGMEARAPAPQSQISDFKSQISDLKREIEDLKKLAESCSRQLRGWADSLQNSDIKGQRYLNEKSKQAFHSKQKADAFWATIEANAKRIVEDHVSESNLEK